MHHGQRRQHREDERCRYESPGTTNLNHQFVFSSIAVMARFESRQPVSYICRTDKSIVRRLKPDWKGAERRKLSYTVFDVLAGTGVGVALAWIIR